MPLQDTTLAIEELQRIVTDFGVRGIEINANVNAEELSGDRLHPFWAKVESLDILVFMHPMGFTEGQRLTEHHLNNLVGQPLGSTLAISHLIFAGVLDAHPGLRICVARGGGFLPGYPGRMDHAYHARSHCRHGASRPPSEYLKQFYYESVVFDPAQLSMLVSRYGADQVLLGSDYPYAMGDPDPVGFVRKAPSLGKRDIQAICGGNAARLLDLAARH